MARITHLALDAITSVPLPIWVLALLLVGCVGTRIAGGGHLIDALLDLGEPSDRDEYQLPEPGAAT